MIDYSALREENKQRLLHLYTVLGIESKVPTFDELFNFSAMNILGFNLPDEDSSKKEKTDKKEFSFFE